MQSLGHLRRQKRKVADREQIFGDEPEMLVGGHPLKAVEASEVYGIGKSSERALAAQVEIDLEVAHGEFAQSSVNRFAITAPGVIRFRYRTPVAVLLVHGDHVIRVVLGFEV